MVLATLCRDLNTRPSLTWWAAAKAKKNVSYGTIGSGSLGPSGDGPYWAKTAGLEWQRMCPTKGGGPLMSDAVAGHVPLSIGSVFVTKPHIDSKRMRPLVVTSPANARPDLPDVPTVAESGFPRL
jgi:tripartite-type tricarboxylate transporter receptor subunit TctC